MRIVTPKRALMASIVASILGGLVQVALAVPPAQADEPERLGFLVVDPPQGDLLTPMDIATSDVCTRGQMFAVKLDGRNVDSKEAGNLIGATKLDWILPESYPGHYVVPLPTDLATYLSANAPGQRIKGEYTLTFACRDTLSTADLQIFTAKIIVDGQGRYDAQGESARPIEDLIDGYVPPSEGMLYGDPAAPSSEEAAEYAAEQPEQQEQPTAPAAAPWRMILIVAGALLLLGAAYAYWRGRRKEVESDESVSVGS